MLDLDKITAEMLKALGDFGINKLTKLFNDIYDTGFLPDEMLASTYITLPKKKPLFLCNYSSNLQRNFTELQKKGNNSDFFSKNLSKQFLDSHMYNVMPKL